jgi:hypothetical protein
LKNFRINGVSTSNVQKGERGRVLVRAEITSDQPEFHLFMQGITNLVVGKAKDAGVVVQMDRVSAMLVVTHEGGVADLYLQDFPFEIEILAKHDVAKGEMVYHSDITDVRRLRMSWLALQPKDGVLCCFKVGWKFALFFDLHPERILDVDAMERSLGRLYRRLTFQALYDALESEAGLSKLVAAGWFPFIETIGGEFEELLKAYRDDFNVEEETAKLLRRFDARRIDGLAMRWWKGSLLSRRRDILEPALEAFTHRDPVSCIQIILTEIEGILQDLHIGEQGSEMSTKELLAFAANRGVQKASDPNSLLFPQQFLRYMRAYTYARFDPRQAEVSVMSRHSVAREKAMAKAYTMGRALQSILTLDQINFYV